MSSLTLEPEVLRPGGGAWEQTLLSFVRRAGQAGQTVTVSARETLWTPEQVAAQLMVSRSTISRWIAAGRIESLMVGNRHRIPYREMLRLWNEQMDAVARVSAPDIEADLFGDE